MNAINWSTSDIDRWVQAEQAALQSLNAEVYQRTYVLHQMLKELERRLIRPA
jgi:hypothetical protein